MEYASVFLSPQTRDNFESKKVNQLQEEFTRLLSLVDVGLKRNNVSIQVPYRLFSISLRYISAE